MLDCHHGIPTNLRCGACEEEYVMDRKCHMCLEVIPGALWSTHLMTCSKLDEDTPEMITELPTSGYADAETPDSVDFGAPRVRFKWATPDGDKMIAHMARVSNSKATPDDPAEKLIGFLIRNHHWSPFEMANLCLEIHTERDISAQILRHSKEFRFQEFSTRYAEVEDLRWSTECRFQDNKNRQNSFTPEQLSERMDGIPVREAVKFFPEDLRDSLLGAETDGAVSARVHKHVDDTVSYFDAVSHETRVRSLETYQELLRRGVAKGCARRFLPIGLMPTVMYINSNVRGWIHYLAERTKPGVQKEHREIALAVEPVFAEHYPLVWAAVLAYRAELERNNWRVETMKRIEGYLDLIEPNWRNEGIDPLEILGLEDGEEEG